MNTYNVIECMLIYKDSNINLSNFKLGNDKVNNIDIFKKTVYYNNNMFLLQTPKCIIINKESSIRYFNRKFLKIYLVTEKNNYFVELLLNIEQQLKEIYINKFGVIENWRSCIKFKDDQAYIRLTIPFDNNDNYLVNIYDLNETNKGIEYLITGSKSLNIITPYELWKSHNNYGVNWNLIQSKIFLPIYCCENCLIEDEFKDNPLLHYHNFNTDNKEQLKNTYLKYHKMYKMGIPLGAIKLEIEKAKEHSYQTFKDIFDIKDISSSSNIVILNKNVIKKKSIIKKRSISDNITKFKPPTENDLKYILNNLKKIV